MPRVVAIVGGTKPDRMASHCHAYCHRVCRSVLKCTEVKTAKSVCTEVYRSVRVLRRLNGVAS
jgi:hypothetical protein